MARPIDFEEALGDVSDYAKEILRRNQILIDYYIYPKPTPTEIAAYEPRIKSLQSRIKNLQKLNYRQTKYIINDPDCLAAGYLIDITKQLEDAVYGFRKIFQEHYDQNLTNRSPYGRIDERLRDLRESLHDLIDDRKKDSSVPLAADERPAGPTHFCRGAVQLVNGQDGGKLGAVQERDLLKVNLDTVKQFGGCHLWWKCGEASCKFKIRFHVTSSKDGSIQTNDEIREHVGVPMEYRSIWMAKSHLHSPDFDKLPKHAAKYGCLFCFGEGKKLENGRTTFASGKDLATHVCSKHKDSLPPPLMLNKLNIAVNDKLSDNRKRWEVKLHTR